MSKIALIGNVNFIMDGVPPIKLGAFILNGDLSYMGASNVSLRSPLINCDFPTSKELHLFAKGAKGKYGEEFMAEVHKELGDEATNLPIRDALISITLLKALLLTYEWIEYELSTTIDNIPGRIHDSFAIDYSGRLEPQRDIFFINSEYEKKYSLQLNRLVELNLLARIDIDAMGNQFSSYLITLLKPGIPKSLFAYGDPSQDKGPYEVWQMLLADRERTIKTWLTPR
jgi:hypothetical protein